MPSRKRDTPAGEHALEGETTGQKVTRAVVTTSASQAAIVVLLFATSVAQARLLGPEGRGELARFANAGGLLVLLFGFGISSAITYFIANGAGQPRALLRRFRPAFALTVGAVFVGMVGVTASGLRELLPQSIADEWLVVAMTLFFALTQLGSWLSAVMAARGAFNPINASAVFVTGVGTAVSVALLWLAPAWADASAIIALVIALEGVRAVLLVTYLVHRGWLQAPPEQASGQSLEGPSFAQVWRYSALTYVADTLQFLSYRLDMWIVDAYHGVGELGVYALAVSLAQLVWIVPAATARVVFPYAAMRETPDAARLTLRAASTALAISAACGLVGWVLSQLFLTTLFGEEFAEVPSLIGILLLGIVPFSAAKVIGNYLAGMNAVGLNALSTVVTLFIAIGMDLLLIPTMGATGAAWATAVSYSLQTLLLGAFFMHASGLSLRDIARVQRPE